MKKTNTKQYPHPIGPLEQRLVACPICGEEFYTRHFNAKVYHGRCAIGDEYVDNIEELKKNLPPINEYAVPYLVEQLVIGMR